MSSKRKGASTERGDDERVARKEANTAYGGGEWPKPYTAGLTVECCVKVRDVSDFSLAWLAVPPPDYVRG